MAAKTHAVLLFSGLLLASPLRSAGQDIQPPVDFLEFLAELSGDSSEWMDMADLALDGAAAIKAAEPSDAPGASAEATEANARVMQARVKERNHD